MKVQKGFAPLFILLFAGALITAGTISFRYFIRPAENKSNGIQNEIPSFLPPTETPPPPTLTPKLIVKPTTIPTTATAYVSINDNGNPILDNTLWLHIRNENSQEEKLLQNNSSSWKISDIKPGKYKITIPFSYKKYFNPERNCEGCRDKEDKSDFEICGYVVNLLAGDTIKITCTLRATQPLNVPGENINNSMRDTGPPNTNIYYPAPNGLVTYKINGKVCAIASQPNDDSGPEGIETEYRFDDGPWSGYAAGRTYLCTDTLPDGPHTLSYHSKDKAGNVEATKTISFTVNIPGN